LGKSTIRQLERFVVLSTLDQMWMDHLDDIQSLRDGIWLRGDKQTVLSEYKKEAFGMFETLINRIESEVAKRIFRVQVNQPMQPRIEVSQIQAQKDETDLLRSVEKEQTAVAAPKSRTGSLNDLAQALNKAKAPSKPKPGVAQAKIGRNDLCPCGSGKKWKKCVQFC
jgi:preprotein translocase subunit SecA